MHIFKKVRKTVVLIKVKINLNLLEKLLLQTNHGTEYEEYQKLCLNQDTSTITCSAKYRLSIVIDKILENIEISFFVIIAHS